LSSFSIVVVTWECSPHLERLVATMNEHLSGDEELIVVDNASSDEPEEVARRFKGDTEFVGLPDNTGFGNANNVGVARANGEAVVLLNPDTELVDSSLGALAEAALELEALVGPRALNPDGSVQPSASGPEVGIWPWIRAFLPGALAPPVVRRHTEPWRLDTTVPVTWLTGACVAGPRRRLAELGPFDPGIHMYAEDLDLGVRAEAAGVPSYFCPDRARVIHHGKGSSSAGFGSAAELQSVAARNRRAVLTRAYGARASRRSSRALVVNLGLRLAPKRALGIAPEWKRAEFRAARARDEAGLS